jgi:moderate conductance mechanosensitive channel
MPAMMCRKLLPLLGALVLGAIALLAAGVRAQEPSVARVDPPPQVRELLRLLDDPDVRAWIERQRAADSASGAPSTPTLAREETASRLLEARRTAIRAHFVDILAALPTVPAQLGRVGSILYQELRDFGAVGVVALIAGFVALGFGAEWLFRRIAANAHRAADELRLETVNDRLLAAVTRFALGVGQVLAFAAGSIGAALAFPWPPVLRNVLFSYLTAFLVLRIALAFARLLLAPDGRDESASARFRIVPMGDEAARYWYRRIGVFVGWFAFGYATVALLIELGLPPAHRRLVAYALGLGLLAIGLDIAWRRPRPALPAEIERGAAARRITYRSNRWLLSLYFILLWALWVAGTINLFWLAVVAVALPIAIRATQRAVNHILRPPDAASAEASLPSVVAVCLDRGLRALLIFGAVMLLADKWGIDLVALTANDTQATRLTRGALSAVIVLLVADLAWHVVRATIDRRLIEAQEPGQLDSEEARRRSRIRTLLPILRNILLIVMIAIAAMMALASLGVEIGPLIAGAGVVGVAIGFGAQTLVRDVISGMFYLLDDAFRVGEYIQSGNYKGTVESFSLRSVKLRHHRGPLYTVPFGALGAVQNMSRDWVIDKLTVRVTYDSDLDKAKKIIKQIGKELSADPEFAPHILQPLKMQGVGEFADFAIQLQMKIMTRPGEQFVIRRRAYALIKKGFDANGIKFAFPTVQVAGEGEGSAAAVARQTLELVKPAPGTT